MIAPPHSPSLHWRQVQPEEALYVYRLHLKATADAPPGLVRPDTLAYFQQHLAHFGYIIAAFNEDAEMLAYGVLSLGSPLVAQIAKHLALDAAQAAQLVFLDGAATHPDWRGQSLHQRLIEERIQLAKRLGCELVASTVAPTNRASLRNLLAAGLGIRRFGWLYGGLPRFIVLREPCDSVKPQAVRRVMLEDLEGHQAALAVGLLGFACQPLPEQRGWQVLYGLPVS